jgi:L,D-transpeptidase YcbB
MSQRTSRTTAVLIAAMACSVGFGTPAKSDILSGFQEWLSPNRQPAYNPNQQPEGYYPGEPQRGAPGWGRGGQPPQHPQQQAQPQEEEADSFTRQWATDPPRGHPTLATRNIDLTRAAIERYQSIVAHGGWPMVPALALKPGSRGQEVAILSRRLEMSGDLVGRSSSPDQYDPTLAAAVKRFQIRHGLAPTGALDRATVDAMNVPAGIRLQQLQLNLVRLQELAPKAPKRYIMVNIPAAQAEAVEGGQVVSRHATVVGKLDRATPELSSSIHEINFNPYWNVPRSIAHKDLIPKGREFSQRGEDMLAAYHMQAFDGSGRSVPNHQIDWFGSAVYNYTFRQRPWEENSLGFVKLNFHNKHAVYLHDTPLQTLFGRNARFESSGCVRVHNIEQLTAWILRDNAGWDLQRITNIKHTGEQTNVKVAKQVPIQIVYLTAWTTPDGMVHFRPDIYQRDTTSETASVY